MNSPTVCADTVREFEPPGVHDYFWWERRDELVLLAVELQPPFPIFDALPEPDHGERFRRSVEAVSR